MTVVKTIDNVVKSCSYLRGTFNENAIISQKLAIALSGYSAEAIKAAIAQSTLNETQIRAILVEKGFKGQLLETTTAELAQITTTNEMVASETAATASTIGLGTAIKGLGASIKAFALSNPILLTIAAVIGAFSLASKVTAKFSQENEKLEKKIEKTTEKFSEATSQIDEINKKLEDNKNRIEEINKLENPTYVDEKDLENLREQNKLLEKQKAIIEGSKTQNADDKNKALKKKFEREYTSNDARNEELTKSDGIMDIATFKGARGLVTAISNKSTKDDKLQKKLNLGEGLYNLSNLSEEELQKYNDLIIQKLSYVNNPNNIDSTELDNAIEKFGISVEDAISVGTIDSILDLDKKIESNNKDLGKQRDDLLKRLSEYDETDPDYQSEGAQEILKRLAAIYKYTNTDKWITDSINEVLDSDAFSDIAKTINAKLENGETITYENLISDDSYDSLIKGIAQKLYNATDEESLKNAASYLADHLMTEVNEGVVATSVSFADAFNSPDFSSAKEKLLELAAAGELTPETISSTEEYKSLLDKTGLSAEYCIKRINDLVSAQDKLANVTDGLSSITNLYKQANENGFADIKDLTKLDDTWKNLSSYEEFVNIVGSGTHSMEEMQQAFNKLTSEYLEHTNVLDKVSESNKDLFINQLKSIGISNAQALVEKKLAEQYLNDISTYKGLTQANKELYVEKLKSRGFSNAEEIVQKALTAEYIAQTNALDGLTEANKEEYISKLEAQGITDANAIVSDRLRGIKEAEETVTKKLNMTMDEFNSKSYEVQNSLLDEANATNICRGQIMELQIAEIHYTNQGLDISHKIEQLKQLALAYGFTGTKAEEWANLIANSKGYEGYHFTEGDLNIAEEELRKRIIESQFNNYVTTSTSASYNGDDDYRKEQAEKAKKEAEKSKETFDWIETKINRLKTIISELGETASDTFKSLAERLGAYGNEISKVTEEIRLQKDAYNKYMEKANSVGLSEEWASKVRDGSLDISEITDDTLKNQIKDYQSWYDKAQDCLNTVNDLEKELSQLNIDRLQLSIDKASRNLDKIKSKSEKIQDKIDDDSRKTKASDYDKLDKSYSKEIKNYEKQNELLRQQQQYVDKGSEEWEELEAKIRSNNDAIDELEKNIKDNKNLRIQIEIDRVTRNLDRTKSKSEKIQNKIDDDTRKTKASDYDRLDKSYGEEIASYKEENRLLREKQKNVEKGSKAWNDYQKSIDENNESIKELGKNIKKNKISRIQIKIDVKTGELNSLEKYGAKISDKIGLKEASGQTVKASDYSKLNVNAGEQIENLQSQNRDLRQQQKNVEKGSKAWEKYQDAIDSNNSSIRSLTKEMVENAKAMAALNNAKAEKKVEKADSSDELLDAKAANSISYKTKNSYIGSKNRNIGKRKKAYDDAVSANRKSFKKAGNSINGIKSNSKNKSILKKIKSYVKKGKAIPAELIQSAAKVDTKLAEKCAKYNGYLTELETSKTNAELYKYTSKQEKAELAKEKLENIEKHYSDRQGTYKQRSTRLDSKIDLVQAKGYQVSTKYYDRLIANEKKNNASLVEERDRLTKSLDNSVKNGSIKKYSPEWYELRRQIDEVTNSIDESDKSLQEYKNHLRQIKWDNFEYLEGRISNIISESDFMINQLSRKDLTSDETGGLTDEGKAVASLHSANYKAYSKQSVDYKKQIDKINKDLAKDPYNKELLDHKEELIKLYQDSINAANDEKDSIIDLYTQGYDALKNKIAEVISEYEELLDAEKSAYDYQNTIADKTKQIASIKKQLAAYSNGTSEETKAKIQKLTVSLEEAEKDLKDTQYDRFISDTKDILGDLQDTLSEEIDNIIKNMRDDFSSLSNDIDKYSSDAADTITAEMKGIGYVPTENFNTILNSSDFSKGMAQAISDTKDYHKKMLEYADKLQRSDGKEFLKETLEDAEQARSEKKSKISDSKKDRDDKYEKMQKSKTAYETAKKVFGKNSTAAKVAKAQYEKSKEEYKKSDKDYRNTKEKSGYESADKLVDVLTYLNKHLNVTKKSRDELSDLNKVFYDTFGQRILSDSEVEKLAKLLNVKSGQKKNGNLYKTLKEMGIPGFKMGTRNMLYDGVAMLAEEGQEIQFDRSQGVLRTVGQGDMIFTNEMAENLWKLAQNNPIPFNTDGFNITPLPELKSNFNSGDVNINMGGIVMNGVNDPEEFSKELNKHLATNPKTIKILQNQSIGSLSKNYNSLGSRRFL